MGRGSAAGRTSAERPTMPMRLRSNKVGDARRGGSTCALRSARCRVRGRVSTMKRIAVAALAVVAMAFSGGCSCGSDPTRGSTGPTTSGDTWLMTDSGSPSGRFRAAIALHDNFMAAVSVVEIASGTVVFDVGSYSTSRLHKFGVGWLTTEPEQLWVYSGDVSCAKVEIQANGDWVKSSVSRENLPAEVTRWW